MAVAACKAVIRAWLVASEWVKTVMVVTIRDTVGTKALVQRSVVGMEAVPAADMLRWANTTNVEGTEADMEDTAPTINTAAAEVATRVAMANMKPAIEGRITTSTVGGDSSNMEMEADMEVDSVATELRTSRGPGDLAGWSAVV